MKDKTQDQDLGTIRRMLSQHGQQMGIPLTIQTIIIRLVILDYQAGDQTVWEAIEEGTGMMRNVMMDGEWNFRGEK